uniref:Putative secreted peptide n=1 Tax=Anopheles braziliensis TaxID=58242 RepID=A0A2M3ZWQ4_9DIPT
MRTAASSPTHRAALCCAVVGFRCFSSSSFSTHAQHTCAHVAFDPSFEVTKWRRGHPCSEPVNVLQMRKQFVKH